MSSDKCSNFSEPEEERRYVEEERAKKQNVYQVKGKDGMVKIQIIIISNWSIVKDCTVLII